MNKEIELVLTLPDSLGPEMMHLSRSRTTIGVLTEMIAKSQQEIVIATPYIKEDILSESILQIALIHAVNKRNVDLSIVSTGKSLDGLDEISWIMQNNSKVHFYRPKNNINDEKNIGSHAKFCISDRMTAYIGSANLTYSGLHKHLEMGVLLNGDIVNKVSNFWQLLLNNEFFVEEKYY